MARFDFTGVPSVAPTGAPGNDYERIDANPAMFGGLVANAEERLGQGVESVGNAGLSYAQARQGLTNEISASETNTWLAKNLTDKFNEFGKLSGKAAQDALPQFKQDTEDLYQKSLENAGSNLQMRAMLAKSGRYLTDAYYRYGTSHADQQWRTWQAKTFDDRAGEFGSQAAVAAQHGTWDEVSGFLDTSDDEVRKKFEAQHLDVDTIATEAAKNRGRNVKTIVETLSATDPRTANAVFDKYRGQMDAASVLAVTSHLKGVNATIEGRSIADEESGRSFRDGSINGAIEKASAATGIPAATLRTFARIESGGQPGQVTGSYKGLFQLSDQEFGQHGGGNIFNPADNAMAAAKKLKAESDDFKARTGRDPTAGELYMIHQQGAAGFAAHMANPDRPAWQNMLSTAEGQQKGEAWARAAIWGNVPDRDKARFGSVDNITSRQFVSLWEARVGGASGTSLPDKAEVFDHILARTDQNPLVQNAAIARMNQLYSVERAEQTQGRVLFDQRAKDEKAEAFDTGAVAGKTPLTEQDFIGRYGMAEGQERWREHQDDLAMGADMMAAAGMSPQDRQGLIDKYTPQPGPGYAAAAQRQQAFMTAMRRLDEERKTDPAGLALRRLPDVRAAYQGMAQAEQQQGATPEQVKAARANFAAVMHGEQARIGIPADEQRLLPKAAIDEFNGRFARAADAEDPQARVALVGQVQREAALWGEAWPAVMRQLAPGTQPIVRAIAAGADPVAMTRLLALPKDMTVAKIMGEVDENGPKAKDVHGAVIGAMAPFARTLVGRQLERDYPGYLGLAEKLAALGVRDGKSASDAGSDAFDALIGNRFEFRDTWRMPKSAGVSADDVHAGAQASRGALAELGAKPPVDNMPGRTNAAATDLRAAGRDGRWITAPDQSGLMLALPDGTFLRRASDGRPLVLGWNDLAARGRAEIARPTLTQGMAAP